MAIDIVFVSLFFILIVARCSFGRRLALLCAHDDHFHHPTAIRAKWKWRWSRWFSLESKRYKGLDAFVFPFLPSFLFVIYISFISSFFSLSPSLPPLSLPSPPPPPRVVDVVVPDVIMAIWILWDHLESSDEAEYVSLFCLPLPWLAAE